MNETAERRQGAENACQRLRRRVLTATAALAAAALVFGWLAAGAVRRSEVFTWGSLEVSFTGEGFTGSPAARHATCFWRWGKPAASNGATGRAGPLLRARWRAGPRLRARTARCTTARWRPWAKRKPRCASSCLTGCRAARRARERRSRYTPFRAAAWPRPARPGRR